ncbi:MAG: carbohydrate binding family 9 domain-containing protein [Candidatus Omnitrophica bacterium]|nr:carbohydrate binding family 9 domain-containing protein [Candidatus Omnitrophota bacterium]
MKKELLIIFLFLLQFLLGQNIPEIKVPYIKSDVKIDGVLEETCWKNAREITDFIITFASKKDIYGQKPKNKTVGYIFYDDDYLYIAVECYDEDAKNLRIWKMTERDKGWGDDCVEIFIDPGLSRKRTYQYIINAKGIVYDQKFDDGKNIVDWDSGFEYGVKVEKEKWVVETKIPFAELELREDMKAEWGFNITRFEPREWIVQSWAPVFGGNLQPDKFGIIKDIKVDYTRYKFILDLISWGNLYIGDDFVEYSIKNISKSPLNLIFEIYTDRLLNKKDIKLKPEETKNVSLDYSLEKKDGKLTILVKDEQGKISYMRTKYFKIPESSINIKSEIPVYYLSDKNIIAELEISIGRNSLKKSEIIFQICDIIKGSVKNNRNKKRIGKKFGENTNKDKGVERG